MKEKGKNLLLSWVDEETAKYLQPVNIKHLPLDFLTTIPDNYLYTSAVLKGNGEVEKMTVVYVIDMGDEELSYPSVDLGNGIELHYDFCENEENDDDLLWF